jgi:hypothetical protein
MATINHYEPVINSCVGALDATLSSIDNPTGSFVGAFQFPDTLSGTLIEALCKYCERWGIQYEDRRTTPTLFTASLYEIYAALCGSFTGPTIGGTPALGGTAFYLGTSASALAAAATVTKSARMITAAHMAYELGVLYQEDQERWNIQKKAEKTKPFDALGNYTPLETETIMTVTELERTLYDARTLIQAAVDEMRDNGAPGVDELSGLKNAALQLERHVAKVKVEREKITTVTLDNPMPMHLVCLRYGLDYHTAERLVAVNPQVNNPNMASREVNIYVV